MKYEERERQLDGWNRERSDGFSTLLSELWVKIETSGRKYGLLVRPEHLNSGGAAHGGALLALADHAMGNVSIAVTGHRPQVTIQMGLQFISAAHPGELVEASCSVTEQTRSLVFMECVLSVGARVVGKANGVWKKRRPR